MNSIKHEFAIYVANLNRQLENIIKISEEAFYHRIVRVLRLNINDELIIFNREIHVYTQILEINKDNIILEILKISENNKFEVEINILICLLKPDAFEQAIYSCVELGANSILPVVTKKVYNKKLDIKYKQRLEKIIIAAAEQSKNFCFPQINDQNDLESIIALLPKNSIKIYLDHSGKELLDVIKLLKEINNNVIFMMVGPEGDLTSEERKLLEEHEFIFCSLTPTTLRSQSALACGLGIFRSLYKL